MRTHCHAYLLSFGTMHNIQKLAKYRELINFTVLVRRAASGMKRNMDLYTYLYSVMI